MKLRNYTLRYLIVALLGVIALWASLFYVVILDEVYDNIDDGLKNSKILIIRQAYADKRILDTPEFGINQFKIVPLPKGQHDPSEKFESTFEFSEYDNEDQPVRLLKTVFNDPEGNPHLLTIRASMVEEDELMEDLMTALIALYAMLVISIAAINHIILRKVWKSFYATLDKLRLYKLGTGTGFIAPASTVDEFKTLGRELEEMLRRNEEIYASQKQFIENAAHELQTPLAISLNRLELFAENNQLPEEQMMELGKISDTLQRLVRLNKSLLMLSKIENRQFAGEDAVDFNQIVKQLAEDYSDLAEYKNISITVEDHGQLYFLMNKGLAVTLVSNLVKNAIVHNTNGGSVVIKVTSDSLVIKNTGSTVALDAAHIFKRFTHNPENEQSIGLGLSIVSSIIATYRLKVAYSFDGSHIFTVTFPK
ncbi:HAMP domain-containing histidine kinase [Flavobacterium sp. MFBS3-15]|uniref:sensor histidine kinase n=1 Tax=Flavobacterium sp. MFBS3-15 TaxID=2989816 RepID=UPI002235AFDF|nr:HAMP domain-containing sensor histidine kinase [Flavobacterium sp. MFBS3-15]MCW4467505.1 HAMP domain-containing histidine kinase [Flavobacterium sp. MFBS3-15]